MAVNDRCMLNRGGRYYRLDCTWNDVRHWLDTGSKLNYKPHPLDDLYGILFIASPPPSSLVTEVRSQNQKCFIKIYANITQLA